MVRVFLLLAALAASALLEACVIPGQSAYRNDPLTGGIDASSSALLHITLPAGLQLYPTHSSISGGGRKEGLETWRGHVDQQSCGSQIYAALRQAGWQMRMHAEAGSRAIYIYQKDDEIAAIVFQAQGMLTIVQIWAGARLADNATPKESPNSDESWRSLPGESFAPEKPAQQGEVETWGVREREL